MLGTVLAATALLALTPAAPAALDPAVRIAARDPLTLAGRGFKPRERVKLTVELGAVTQARRVRARATGTFEIAFAAMALQRCHGGLAVSAVGDDGSRVRWKLLSLHCGPED
jgi:hypothetical protein